MKIAIIGRTEVLYETACRLHAAGYEIVCILTAKEAPEYEHGVEDFRRLAENWGIPFRCSGKIIDQVDFLSESAADISVSINYSGTIPKVVTDLFPLGILNAHGGDLPRYRGNACQSWAIINGEKKIGLCIHKMVGGELDSGPIIIKDYMAIDNTVKIGQILTWIRSRTPELMLAAVKQLEQNPNYYLEKQSTDVNKALRCYPRRPEDGKINWNRPAVEILMLINASGKPYAGAYCEFEGKKISILDAELSVNREIFIAIPGQITGKIGDYVEVACKKSKLVIKKIEINQDEFLPSEILVSLRGRLI